MPETLEVELFVATQKDRLLWKRCDESMADFNALVPREAVIMLLNSGKLATEQRELCDKLLKDLFVPKATPVYLDSAEFEIDLNLSASPPQRTSQDTSLPPAAQPRYASELDAVGKAIVL